MPLILHGKEASPPCRAVLITAKVVGVDVQLRDVDLISKTNKSDEFMKMNPNHSIPTLDDNGFYLWESRPIMCYLVDKYGKDEQLYPKELKRRIVVDQMLHFDNGSLSASISQYFYPQLFAGENPVPAKEASMHEKFATLETILGRTRFVAGHHLTVADIAVVTTLSMPPAFGLSYDQYPNIAKYIVNVKADLPAYDEVAAAGESSFASFVKCKWKK